MSGVGSKESVGNSPNKTKTYNTILRWSRDSIILLPEALPLTPGSTGYCIGLHASGCDISVTEPHAVYPSFQLWSRASRCGAWGQRSGKLSELVNPKPNGIERPGDIGSMHNTFRLKHVALSPRRRAACGVRRRSLRACSTCAIHRRGIDRSLVLRSHEWFCRRLSSYHGILVESGNEATGVGHRRSKHFACLFRRRISSTPIPYFSALLQTAKIDTLPKAEFECL